MTDDLADVIGHDSWCEMVERKAGPDATYSCSCDAAEKAAAVHAHYLALGGVTDEDMVEALCSDLPAFDHAPAVRDLIARAVGHAVAERDALRATVDLVVAIHHPREVAVAGPADPSAPVFTITRCSCGSTTCRTLAALDGEP
jgi:hypothetical protein